MTDYRLVMRLLIQQHTYRHIERLTGSSHRTIAKASKICREHHFTTIESIDALTAEELDELFADGRKTPSQHFVDFNVHDTVNKRLGKKNHHCASCGRTTWTLNGPDPRLVDANIPTIWD